MSRRVQMKESYHHGSRVTDELGDGGISDSGGSGGGDDDVDKYNGVRFYDVFTSSVINGVLNLCRWAFFHFLLGHDLKSLLLFTIASYIPDSHPIQQIGRLFFPLLLVSLLLLVDDVKFFHGFFDDTVGATGVDDGRLEAVAEQQRIHGSLVNRHEGMRDVIRKEAGEKHGNDEVISVGGIRFEPVEAG